MRNLEVDVTRCQIYGWLVSDLLVSPPHGSGGAPAPVMAGHKMQPARLASFDGGEMVFHHGSSFHGRFAAKGFPGST